MEPAWWRSDALTTTKIMAAGGRRKDTELDSLPTTIAPARSRDELARLLSSDGAVNSDPLNLIGETIQGGYRVSDLISQGGLSLVYRATDPETGDVLALKCFHGLGQLPADDLERFRARFQRVSELVGQLAVEQAGLVRPIAQGWIDSNGEELPCLLMEWIEGFSLESLLDKEREAGLVTRSAAEILNLMQQPIEALAAAHNAGLIHRDVKPSNIFVGAPRLDLDASVKVLDFTLARFSDEKVGDVGVTFMTPDYAAPEQFRGYESHVGPWTDVYSLALVLVEMMLGGQSALRGEDFEALRAASLDPKKRPTPGSLGLDVPNPVESVFKRALAVDVHERFSNAGHFLRAFSRAVEASGGRVTSTGISRVSGEFKHDPSERARRKYRRRATVPSPRLRPPAQTGDTVIAPAPVRTGNTVLAPIPTSEDE